MLNIITSGAEDPSTKFAEVERIKTETNTEWLTRQLDTYWKPDATFLVLIGSEDRIGFRLRVAQAHLRHDLSPSHWSHAMLLGSRKGPTREIMTYEVSLDPPTGFGIPTGDNAMQEGKLSTYDDAKQFPNVALLRLPVKPEDWRGETTREKVSVKERFKKQRSVLDVTELVLQWLAFLWGVGRASNPLLDGYGVPTAAMIEAILNAVGYDITPALESRASCPEAIWQAAKWWHPYYREHSAGPVQGAWHIGSRIGVWPPKTNA